MTTSKVLEVRGTSAVLPGMGGQVHHVVGSDSARVLQVAASAGFEVVGVIVGQNEPVWLAEGQSLVEAAGDRELLALRGQYVIVSVRNITQAAATPSVALDLDVTGEEGPQASAEPPPEGVAVPGPAAGVVLERLPARPHFALMSSVDRGEDVPVLLGRHQLMTLASWLDNPNFAIPAGLQIQIGTRLSVAQARKVAPDTRSNAAEMVAWLPAGLLEQVTIAVTRRAPLALHDDDRRETASRLRSALAPTPPAPARSPAPALARSPVPGPRSPVHETVEPLCDACSSIVGDDERFLVVSVASHHGHMVAGESRFLFCQSCAVAISGSEMETAAHALLARHRASRLPGDRGPETGDRHERAAGAS